MGDDFLIHKGGGGETELADGSSRCHFTKAGEIVWVFRDLSSQTTQP